MAGNKWNVDGWGHLQFLVPRIQSFHTFLTRWCGSANSACVLYNQTCSVVFSGGGMVGLWVGFLGVGFWGVHVRTFCTHPYLHRWRRERGELETCVFPPPPPFKNNVSKIFVKCPPLLRHCWKLFRSPQSTYLSMKSFCSVPLTILYVCMYVYVFYKGLFMGFYVVCSWVLYSCNGGDSLQVLFDRVLESLSGFCVENYRVKKKIKIK